MVFKKGQSGNPNGRPKKGRTLTHLVEVALNRTMEIQDDKTGEIRKVARKRVMADLLAQGITEGKIKFPGGGSTMTLKPDEWGTWIDKVIKILHQVDGPPAQEHDVNLDHRVRVEDLDGILGLIYGDDDDTEEQSAD